MSGSKEVEISLRDALGRLPQPLQIPLFSLLVSLIAVHAAYLPVNLLGKWIINWTYITGNLAVSAVLAFVLIIGLRLRRLGVVLGIVGGITAAALIYSGWDLGDRFLSTTWVSWVYLSVVFGIAYFGGRAYEA